MTKHHPRQRHNIRAVAVDIDGTVTNYERRLDLTGVRALRSVEARGIPVLAATGNVPSVTRTFSDFVGISGPLICENGGVVYSRDLRQKKVLASRTRPDRAVQLLKRRGFDVKPLWSDRWRESEVALQLNLDEGAVRRALSGWGLAVVGTRFALHLSEPGLDKFNGLKVALPLLNIAPRVRLSEVLAIGDSNNDVRMLRGCGRSGAVGNASIKACASADYVARAGHGAGVREILRHFGVL